MRANNLRGYHRSVKDPASAHAALNGSTGSSIDDIQCTGAITVNGDNASTSGPRLLVWSAADESAIRRMLQAYGQYYSTRIVRHRHKLNQLAYTLAVRRSIMAWRTFAVVGDDEEHLDAGVDHVDSANLLKSLPSEKPLRAPTEKTGIAFVFTGQGAQYAGMGMELLRYPVCVQSLRRSDEIFESLGCEWSLFGEFFRSLDTASEFQCLQAGRCNPRQRENQQTRVQPTALHGSANRTGRPPSDPQHHPFGCRWPPEW